MAFIVKTTYIKPDNEGEIVIEGKRERGGERGGEEKGRKGGKERERG